MMDRVPGVSALPLIRDRKIILYAVPGKEPFYMRFGFLRMETAMAIFQNQQEQLERSYLSES
jgi:hypothetical protein